MGSMKELDALVRRVVPGVVVHTTNHDYIKDSGTAEVIVVSDSIYGLDRPGYVTKVGNLRRHYSWPEESDDFEVHGDELQVYKPYHAYTGGRALILTLRFEF